MWISCVKMENLSVCTCLPLRISLSPPQLKGNTDTNIIEFNSFLMISHWNHLFMFSSFSVSLSVLALTGIHTHSTSSSAVGLSFPAQLTPLTSLTSFPSHCCPHLRPRVSPPKKDVGQFTVRKVAQPWRFIASSRSLFHAGQTWKLWRSCQRWSSF